MSNACVIDLVKPKYRPPLSERLRVRWRNWRVRKVGKAVRTLSQALREDKGFRQTWQANIAMPIYDSTHVLEAHCPKEKLTIEECNLIADKLMKHLFGC